MLTPIFAPKGGMFAPRINCGNVPSSCITACSYGSTATVVVQAAIDLDDLLHPARAFAMLEVQDLVVRPMKVIRQVRYLFVEPLYGVAPNPPAGLNSTM